MCMTSLHRCPSLPSLVPLLPCSGTRTLNFSACIPELGNLGNRLSLPSFPKPSNRYTFLCSHQYMLGTRSVLLCEMGIDVSLSWQIQRGLQSYGTVAICLLLVAHRWDYHTTTFDSCCAYRSGKIHVLRISY